MNEIIYFKKKSSILKKNSDYEFNVLNYASKSRDNFYLNHSLNVLESFENENDFNKTENIDFSFVETKKKNVHNNIKINYFFNYKNLDFKRKINLVFQKNRNLLRKFLKVKFKRQNTFNRYIKNFIKLKNLDFLFNFEYKLINLLTRSLFFFNYKDCLWFLKNGYITINGVVEYNQKRLLKPFEIVNVVYNNYYFFYYRFMLDNCISNIYKFNLKIWKINNNRNNIKKKNEESYSEWLHKYIYYKNDIPKFIEVDFISMTMVLLKYTYNKNYMDYYNIKFLNLYLNRLYNWKTVI